MNAKRYERIARVLDQYKRCIDTSNGEWEQKSKERLLALVKNEMPSGSGIDNGTKIDLDISTPDKLVFYVAFHHMDENGYYDGWTEHTLTVRPSLAFGISLSFSGRNRNDIKDYLHQVYHTCLTEESEEYADVKV